MGNKVPRIFRRSSQKKDRSGKGKGISPDDGGNDEKEPMSKGTTDKPKDKEPMSKPLPDPPKSQTPEPATPQEDRVRVRALYDYHAQNEDDLQFNKGDFMEVISNMSDAWWLARHLRSHIEGYIPSNYVTVDDGKPTSLDAWFDITRRDADRLLLLMGNPKGTYIIRPSSAPLSYALSIRNLDERSNIWVVKHYKIKPMDDGGYYITARIQFSHIKDLIEYYERNCDGLCCRLSNPCPRSYRPPVQFREIEVNRDCISMDKKLGGGSFGDVWLAKWNKTVEVAVKTLKPGSMDPERFIQEAELMHRLHHPRIVQILGVCTREEPTLIVTELMVNGSLLDYLRREESRNIKLATLIDMMAQITEGMAYLEKEHFVHRDLRAANILVGENNFVKVADFGLARITQDDDDIYRADQDTKFPIKWTSPEAQTLRQFSVKSDVWSFGVLMYEIVTYGRTPYPGMTNAITVRQVERGYRMPNPQTLNSGYIVCPDELYNIMLECWNSDADSRPTFLYLNEVFDAWSVATERQYVEN